MIEKILKKQGKSMYELAKDIGESDQRTQYIVKKKKFTSDYRLLQRIAKALNVDIEDLMDDNNLNK